MTTRPMMNIVTGAFGYIGKYITGHLLQTRQQVRTITTHPTKPNPFGPVVQAFPYNFDHTDQLIASLHGASTLYNTYYVRFEYGGSTFDQAVRNTATLFKCAKQAGIQRIVHISVTHAAATSDLPYYRGKGIQEQLLMELGLPYRIVRPTLVFGQEDILVNNIAWLIRKFPLFPIFGSGQYRVQPIYVGDLAKIAVDSAGSPDTPVIDAIGSEVYTFEELVTLMISRIRPGVKAIHVPPALGIALGNMIGLAMRDVLLTRHELQGLMAGLLTSDQAPNGTTRFSDWLEQHRHEIGRAYSSELARHFKWHPNA